MDFIIRNEKLMNGFKRVKVIDKLNKEVIYFKTREEAKSYVYDVKEFYGMHQTTLI